MKPPFGTAFRGVPPRHGAAAAPGRLWGVAAVGDGADGETKRPGLSGTGEVSAAKAGFIK